MSEKERKTPFDAFIESDQFDVSVLGSSPSPITHETLDHHASSGEQMAVPHPTALTLTHDPTPNDYADIRAHLYATVQPNKTLWEKIRGWVEAFLARFRRI
jgi:hypothetical protein